MLLEKSPFSDYHAAYPNTPAITRLFTEFGRDVDRLRCGGSGDCARKLGDRAIGEYEGKCSGDGEIVFVIGCREADGRG